MVLWSFFVNSPPLSAPSPAGEHGHEPPYSGAALSVRIASFKQKTAYKAKAKSQNFYGKLTAKMDQNGLEVHYICSFHEETCDHGHQIGSKAERLTAKSRTESIEKKSQILGQFSGK